ncbi:MAG: S9 family peptidase, partial [Candidatus Scalindua sp.]|nr:S9 family peptidase [Candidatus Scalindua sp.]
LICISTSISCSSYDKNNAIIKFHGRSLNITKLLNSFPYDKTRWVGSIKQKRLAFLRQADGQQLVSAVELYGTDNRPVELNHGKAICEHDWSSSLTWEWKIRHSDGSVFFRADENNNESFNIYRIDPYSKKATKLTDATYVPGYSFNPDETKIAYIERMGKEGARSRLHVLDLKTMKDEVVSHDSEAHQFTWSNISWQPNGKGLILTSLIGGDRTKGNLSYVSLVGKITDLPKVLTDTSVLRTFPNALKHWYDNDEVLMLSGESGVKNVYRLNVNTGIQTALTNLTANVNFAEITTICSSRYLIVAVGGPLGSAIYRYDLAKPSQPHELVHRFTSSIDVLDLRRDRILVKNSSATVPVKVQEIEIGAEQSMVRELAELSQSVTNEIVHSTVKPILINTFDKIPLVILGKQYHGKLHGMLYKPTNPLPKGKDIVMVKSFYGGRNKYDPEIQIMCAAGIYVFCPAPRGSSLFSSRFEEANDGDMGGNEIIDVIFAAEHISKQLNIPANRIGAFGHSHGGFATLRLLTFPGQINGIKANFNWGFGISEAGFGSIFNEYEYSNIKQCMVKEAGGNPTDRAVRAKWDDRSPINHVKSLKGELLLIHGTADQRVPFSESQIMYDKLIQLGMKDRVSLVPLDGAGHSFSRNPDKVKVYRHKFSFLERLP